MSLYDSVSSTGMLVTIWTSYTEIARKQYMHQANKLLFFNVEIDIASDNVHLKMCLHNVYRLSQNVQYHTMSVVLRDYRRLIVRMCWKKTPHPRFHRFQNAIVCKYYHGIMPPSPRHQNAYVRLMWRIFLEKVYGL